MESCGNGTAVGPRNGETSRLQGPSRTVGRYSLRGAWSCLRLLQRYSKLPRGCFPGHAHIATKLNAGVSTVEGWIRILKHLKAIQVTHRGPRSSAYSVLWKGCNTWQCFLELVTQSEGASEKCTDQTVTAKSEGACKGALEGASRSASITELPSGGGTASLIESGLATNPPVQHYSPVVNDAESGEKPPPERQKPNPKPTINGNSGHAFDSEVAEIREALKARALVRLTLAFDSEIRSLLASGETVETLKRAILRGCFLKLAYRDRGDTSLIFSMRYFVNVIADVKPMADPAYWRSVEKRLVFEEQKRFSQKASSLGPEHVWSSMAAPRSFEEKGVS